ncbi:MAG: electron transfer flavoprotein subunit alpha/FixB family protein [Firmicutes bacterium]|nr:electron transfer flavoprotein subunit alpha/FixB family protein [Bacillota bacterium]
MENKEIWIYVQESAGKPLDVSYELLGKGLELSKQLGAKLCAVVLSKNTDILESLRGWADKVYCFADPMLKDALEGPYSDAISALIRDKQPDIMLFGATVFGRSLAPAIAAKLHTGLTADCTILDIDPETSLLRQTRPAFGGNLMATIVCPEFRPQMATVRPGIFPKAPSAIIDETKTELVPCPYDFNKKSPGIQVLEFISQMEGSSIKDAEVLFVCGQGIGSKANVNKVAKLAALVREKYGISADYGVTRPLVDMGWAEYPHQVGQTGLSVAPKILISLGVSGAIQHLAGITGAKTIIAVNTDPEAAIFGAANYAICADCVEIADQMLEAIR